MVMLLGCRCSDYFRTDNDELTRLEPSFNRLHFDKTVSDQPRFDRDVFQRTVLFWT